MIATIVAIVGLYLLFDIRWKLGDKSGRPKNNGTVVMDSSALIDGRIFEVIKSGFVNGTIIVPKRVLDELQLLADGKDSHKRARARYGLDLVQDLKQLKDVNLIIDERFVNSELSTDESVLQIAKISGARMCTTDFNLNKVATVEDVVVMNVNELAQSLRPSVLPGEVIEVKIIQKGESKGQGIGYLDDGTMVVVDKVQRMNGKLVSAIVDRMIQTKAGKMIFATKR